MKLNNIYIISWFGEDGERAEKRRSMHKLQIEWCSKHKLHPVVLAQQYREEDYIEGVEYIKIDYVLHPGPARNVLFEHFYTTDEDFAVFADNDTIIYEAEQHGTSKDFYNILRGLDIAEFKDIDVIGTLNPSRSPFKEELQKEVYKDNLVFRKAAKFNGGMFLVKNVAKHHNKKLFFDEETFSDGDRIITCEEYDFAINALIEGCGVYYTYNIIFKEMCKQDSTWTTDDTGRDTYEAFRLMNKKYNADMFNVDDVRNKSFKYIGYSTSDTGITKIRFAVDVKHRTKVLEKVNHTNVTFYEGEGDTILDLIEYAKKNIDDDVLQEMIENVKGKKFTSVNRKTVNFNWKCIPHKVKARIEIKK